MSNNADRNSKVTINTSRRAFLSKGAASVVLGSVMPNQVFASSPKSTRTLAKAGRKKFTFSPASEKFMSMFKLKYPIVQAPAGGHVHASMQLEHALDKVLAAAGGVPVIASGGIATGKDIHKLLVAGAAGVVMGTRFVATKESGAHKEYKESLVKARSEHTVFTNCMNKGWDNATHRILRNSTFRQWEKLGCPKEGDRPGEFDKIARYGKATDGENTIERYSIDSPGQSISGDIEGLANYAGTGVDRINDIPSVADLVDRIWQELEEQGSE